MSQGSKSAGICPACRRAGARRYRYEIGDIWICAGCKLQWADKSETDLTGTNDVTTVHKHYMDPASLDVPNYPPYLKFFSTIEALRPGPLRILDVGCGNGAFVAACLRRGHDARGAEIDRTKEPLIPPAVRARVDFIAAEELPIPPTPYDVITFWDSFEHLAEPFAVLERLRRCMAAQTVVFVRVNNVHDIFNLVTAAALRVAPGLGKRLLEICFNLPQHYWNFSVPAMKLLAAQAGWQIAAHRITETPAGRLTPNPLFRVAIAGAYAANFVIGGGKIGEYYFVSETQSTSQRSLQAALA